MLIKHPQGPHSAGVELVLHTQADPDTARGVVLGFSPSTQQGLILLSGGAKPEDFAGRFESKVVESIVNWGYHDDTGVSGLPVRVLRLVQAPRHRRQAPCASASGLRSFTTATVGILPSALSVR